MFDVKELLKTDETKMVSEKLKKDDEVTRPINIQ